MNLFDDNSGIISSPFNYTGSKSKLILQLKPYFPKDCKYMVDLFCGGGGFFINTFNDFCYSIANDIITPLMEFYKWLQITKWEYIIEEIHKRNIPPNDQNKYIELRKHFNKTKDFIDFFILVCSCTNNMMRFNKNFEFNQTWGQRCFNFNTERKLKSYWERLAGSTKIEFTNRQFYDVEVSKDDFVYIDPPYYLSEAGYNVFWSKELEQRLYDFLEILNHDGIKFMLSNVSKHKGVENPFLPQMKKYRIIELECDYNKVSRSGKAETQEIIVMNY